MPHRGQVRVDLPEGPAGVAEEVSASPVPEAPLLGAAVCARQPWTACAGADLAAVAEGLRHSPDMFHEDSAMGALPSVGVARRRCLYGRRTCSSVSRLPQASSNLTQ